MIPLRWADVVWHTINDRRDSDGRPLGEQASPTMYASCREERACPYPGGRHGLTMNTAALRQVRRHWPAVLQTVRAWGRPGATVREAWQVTLAAYVVAATHPEPIPAPISALYKTCIGFNQVLFFLLLAADDVGEAPLSALATPPEFVQWLEREGWLLGQDQVCAGPARLIAAVFAALCDGDGGGAGMAAQPPVETVVGWQALAIAAALRGQRARDRGRGGLCERLWTSKAPWMAALRLRPAGEAEVAQRLIGPEKNWSTLDKFLSTHGDTVDEIDQALGAAIEKTPNMEPDDRSDDKCP